MESGGSDVTYDVCVVGAGMIGSAVAKHVLEIDNRLKVALVGPCEIQDRTVRDIHGCHYDEGRITRALDPDPTWALLAQRSLRNYAQIEDKSGIQFFTPGGTLCVGPSGGEYVQRTTALASSHALPFETLSEANMRHSFPYLRVGEGIAGVYSTAQAGYINPRKLVEAQKTIAKQLGCDVYDDIVAEIRDVDGGRHGNVCLTTDSGLTLRGRKVVLATGAFSEARRLLPKSLLPGLRALEIMVVYTEVPVTSLDRYKSMPCVIVHDVQKMVQGAEKDYSTYIMPPILYPDGKYYIKLGHSNAYSGILETPAEIARWYRQGGSPALRDHLLSVAQWYLPDLPHRTVRYDQCVTTHTSTGHVYVDLLTPRLGVALGGCGTAAKSSDEIGRMAARMIVRGHWDYDLPASTFTYHYKVKTQSRL